MQSWLRICCSQTPNTGFFSSRPQQYLNYIFKCIFAIKIDKDLKNVIVNICFVLCDFKKRCQDGNSHCDKFSIFALYYSLYVPK